MTLTSLFWINGQKALAEVKSILLVQRGHWLGKKRRHSLFPVRVGCAESSHPG